MLGNLFWMLAGGAYAGKKVVDSVREQAKNEAEKQFIKDYLAKMTDPELEARLRKQVWDPNNYDEIWERLEEYKRNKGELYLRPPGTEFISHWNRVGEGRPNLFDENGEPIYRAAELKDENGQWLKRPKFHLNVNAVLCLLMHTYGKQTYAEAYNTALRRLGRKI